MHKGKMTFTQHFKINYELFRTGIIGMLRSFKIFFEKG